MSEPHTTQDVMTSSGRETNGRFAKGNSGGPGNPFARKTAALRQALLDTVTEKDIKEIASLLLLHAQGGDLAAIKLLFQYVIGKPQPAVNPDTLDLDELTLLQAASLPAEAVQQFTGKVPPQLALVLLRALIPAITNQFGGAIAATVPSTETAAEQTLAESPPPSQPNASPRRARRPSTNGGNGQSASEPDGFVLAGHEEPPSVNGPVGNTVFSTFAQWLRGQPLSPTDDLQT